MAKKTHINVTFDLSRRFPDGGKYDLRIPVQLNVKQLLLYVMDTLNIDYSLDARSVIKVTTKNLVIADDDHLTNFPITDGDVFVVL